MKITEININRNKKHWILSTLIGIVGCLPISGFLYGFLNCTDCENSFWGILGRVFIGFVYSFLSIITLGEPWDNEAGTSATDIRVYAIITFLILTGIVYLYRKKYSRKKRLPTPLHRK